jgi:uncharacterized protein
MKAVKKKSRLLRYLKKDIYVRIGRSRTHGIGLFAIRDIPKGTDPFKSLIKHTFVRIDVRELDQLHPEVRKMILDYCAQEKGTIYVPEIGLNPVHLLHFINHSDSPNVKSVSDGTKFIAIRRIKKGEELFSDYSTYDENFQQKM